MVKRLTIIYFIYNLLGVIVIYGIPFLRNIPIKAAEGLAELAVKKKLYIAVYVLSVFFIIPALLIAFT